MNQDVVDFIKSLGVGGRHPKDEFFKEGDKINKVHKIFGIFEIDNEEFYHKLYPTFSCHIPGCSTTCETVHEYDQHYNSCHRFSCSECNKYLPSSHLLDLHLMEVHDAYFAALSEKKPMFQCYVQECKNVFQTSEERKDHCITCHEFPSNFRFDNVKKKKKEKKSAKEKTEKVPSKLKKSKNGSQNEENMKMEISDASEENASAPNDKFKNFNFSFGHSRRPRKLNLQCFVKDMKESLPT